MAGRFGLRSFIRQLYGQQLAASVNYYLSLVKKHANLLNQQIFLKNCKKESVIPKSFKICTHFGTENETKLKNKLSLIALNHVIYEQKQRRFQLSKDLNSVENFLRNNLPSDIFMRIKEMAIRSFRHDFHLSKVRLVDKFNKLLFENFQDSDVFYPRHCLGPAIKNLSSKPLNIQQEAVLSKGSKFCFPTPVSYSKIISKVESGIMASIDKVDTPQELRAEIVRKLNTFNMNLIGKDISQKNDIKILSDLKKDKFLTITRADKGNTIVIMNTEDYNNQMKSIISETITYKKLDFDPTDKYVKSTRKELESMKNNFHITPQFYNKYYPRGCSAPKIYGLPKIHKTGSPLRPIVSTFLSPVSKLGKWLSVALRPLLGTQKSYLKNSTDLTNKLRNFTLEESSILCSFDVVSMYSNCDLKRCEDILKSKLEKHFDLIQDVTLASLDIDVIMRLIILVNEFSFYFGFRGEFYRQIFGLPMGASLSPLLANLFIDAIETSAINSFRISPCFWGRFMDDVVCVWKHGLDSLDLFCKHLNSFDNNIKFTVEFEDNNKLPFLDILLIKRDLHLLFSIYRKPTHNDRYLNFHSCHPMSVKRGVVISLVDRAFRICSQEFLDSELLYLRDILFCNSYPIKFIDKIIENRRVKHNSRVIEVSQSLDLVVSKSFISLPYVPGLGEKLSRVLRKFGIDTCFQSLRPMGSFLVLVRI